MAVELPPLRYLTADDVRRAMPGPEERLALAARTMTALALPGAAQLPPKIAVHPRPDGSFVHAMPAHLRGASAGDDLVGMKWVAGFATNSRLGLPAIHAVVVLNDPATGVPIALLDGGPITAERTAAVSGVAIRHFAPAIDRPARVAIVGAGVQGHSHVAIVGHVLAGAAVRLAGRQPARVERLAAVARETAGIAEVQVAGSPRDAVEDADVVVTAASFTTPDRRQAMTPDWLAPHALVVPVDYATFCSAEVVRTADLFLVDHRDQFLANREAGQFDDYPEPTATLGEAILARTSRPPGRVVVTHLGVGLADIVLGAAIVARAVELGLGRILER